MAFQMVIKSILLAPNNRDNKIVSTMNIGAVLKINNDAKEVLFIFFTLQSNYLVNCSFTAFKKDVLLHAVPPCASGSTAFTNT